MLGTQPHSTCRSTSTHCILRLNLVKGKFNIVILDSHTHTSIHLSKQNGISSPNPSIHLSCNSYHHIQGNNQTNMSYPKRKHRHVKIKQTSYHILSKSFTNIIHVHQGKIKIISQTNACSCKCMTYLTTPQHLCIDA